MRSACGAAGSATAAAAAKLSETKELAAAAAETARAEKAAMRSAFSDRERRLTAERDAAVAAARAAAAAAERAQGDLMEARVGRDSEAAAATEKVDDLSEKLGNALKQFQELRVEFHTTTGRERELLSLVAELDSQKQQLLDELQEREVPKKCQRRCSLLRACFCF